MFLRLANYLLAFHILKRANGLDYLARMRYLRSCRLVYGGMVPFCAFCFAACFLAGVCVVFPDILTMLHIDKPVDDGELTALFCLAFMLFAGYFAVLVPVLIAGRQLLASYWILLFIAAYLPLDPNTKSWWMPVKAAKSCRAKNKPVPVSGSRIFKS